MAKPVRAQGRAVFILVGVVTSWREWGGEDCFPQGGCPLYLRLSLCTLKAARNTAVPACTRETLAHRVLAALQHHFHGPGEAAPL